MSTTFHDAWQDAVTTYRAADMVPPLSKLDLAIWRLANLSIIDRDLTAPPGTPSDGDTYIPATGASGSWNGLDGRIVYWDDTASAWVNVVPEEGWVAYIRDEDRWIQHTGSVWVRKDAYIISAFYPGVLDDSAKCMIHVAVYAFQLAAAFSGSYVKASVAATAETIFSIKKNGTEIGTATFAISGTVATLAMAAANDVAAGDTISIVGPSTADATLADVAFSLKGLK